MQCKLYLAHMQHAINLGICVSQVAHGNPQFAKDGLQSLNNIDAQHQDSLTSVMAESWHVDESQ